jgi:amphi-Trp domain-containing protein
MTRVKLNREMTAEEAAEQISHIALGVATGELMIDGEDTSFEFHPGSPMELSIKGEESREEGKLVIELSWRAHLRILGLSPVENLATRGGS